MSNERDIVADAKREGGINAELSRENTIEANAERVGKFFVQFGLICSINYAQKLAVSKEHLWLLPENMFEEAFVITTEVEWHIV